MKFGPASKVKKTKHARPSGIQHEKKSTDMAFWDTRPYEQNLKDKYIKHNGKCPHTGKCKHDSVNLLITNV